MTILARHLARIEAVPVSGFPWINPSPFHGIEPLAFGQPMLADSVGLDGRVITRTVMIRVEPKPPARDEPPVISEFGFDKVRVAVGERATLRWRVHDAQGVSIHPDVGAVDSDGALIVEPSETMIFTLDAVGPGGTTTETARIAVFEPIQPKPLISFGIIPRAIDSMQTATIWWEVQDATSIRIDPEWGIHFTQVTPIFCGLGSRDFGVPIGNDRAIRGWVNGHSLLHQPVEELAAAA